MMDLAEIASLQDGIHELFLLSWPVNVPLSEGSLGLCMIVMKRAEGLLVAVPPGVIPDEALAQAYSEEENLMIGMYSDMVVPAAVIGAEGAVAAGFEVSLVVVDASVELLLGLHRYSEATVAGRPVMGFAEDISFLPDASELLRRCIAWIRDEGQGRVTFYSAEEGGVEEGVPSPKAKAKAPGKAKAAGAGKPNPKQVAEHISQLASLIPTMAAQLTSIQEEQRRLQQVVEGASMTPPPRPFQSPVGMSMQTFAKMMGPPPRTKAVPYMPPPPKAAPAESHQVEEVDQVDEVQEMLKASGASPVALAMLEQSRALTSLVSLLHQGGDPLLDQQASSSTSSKGSLGREKLQRELASRSGGFFLSVCQNAYKRLKPASKMPSSLQELAGTDFSFLTYLERFGGYGNSRDIGIMMYALSFILDCALQEDWQGVQEHAALLAVGLEQASQDNGRWDLAFQLMLLEDPPSQMWQYRSAGLAHTGRARAFAALCPQRWATVALAYTREIDFIQNKRLELNKKNPGPPPPNATAAATPKRRGKFPKGKQAATDADPQATASAT